MVKKGKNKMKLNKSDKTKLRTKLNKLLNETKFDPKHRVHISKNDLESILFDYDRENNCKVIGFKSDNLCKIDLSEVDFSNVDLYLSRRVNLSNTNVNIDFTKLHYSLAAGHANVYVVGYFTDFSNVDLSGMNLSNPYADDRYNIFDFNTCNLSNTKLSLNFDNINAHVRFIDCDLSYNDFRNEKFNIGWSRIEKDNVSFEENCSFANTEATFMFGNHKFEDTSIQKHIDKFRGCTLEFPNRTVYLKSIGELDLEKSLINQAYRIFVRETTYGIIETIKKWNQLGLDENGDKKTYLYESEKFKLNRDSIKKLRNEIAAEFAGHLCETKIKFPKDLLETILFDKEIDENGNLRKKIALHGKVTNLFDYSEIDFEDVSLDCSENFHENLTPVSLNETAKIDLSKTYEYKKEKQLIAKHIDLKGVQLMKVDMKELTKDHIAIFSHVSFEDTELQMNEFVNAYFNECNLTNVFLGNIQINLPNLVDCCFNEKLKFVDCNLTNTGVNFVNLDSCPSNNIKKVYKNAAYIGCYVNGKPIKSKEEIEENKKEVLSKYKKFSDNKINKTLSLVRTQLRKKED